MKPDLSERQFPGIDPHARQTGYSRDDTSESGMNDLSRTTPGQLTDVLAPVESARGLPNAHYVSPVMFEEEREALLFDRWAAVAFEADAPNPGDAVPIDLLGMPLLLLRDRDGALNVFQNTCRHRGMILVREPTTLKQVVRCPYHSWCYGLDGALQATPHVGGPGHNTHIAIEREELGLFRVPSATFLGVVFVNVSGNAAPFRDATAELLERWRDFDRAMHAGGPESRFEMSVNANWKLAAENYCESYHLPWIHPELNRYSKLQDHYDIVEPDRFSGQGSRKYGRLADDDGLQLPAFDGLTARWNGAGEYVTLYPNVLLGVHCDHAVAMILKPDGHGRTVERTALMYTEDGATDPRYEALRTRNAALWRTIFEEDIGVVEGMQAGRHGRLFDGGRFSPAMDGPTHAFHRWSASTLTAWRERNAAHA